VRLDHKDHRVMLVRKDQLVLKDLKDLKDRKEM
jgi:hypothetical protein